MRVMGGLGFLGVAVCLWLSASLAEAGIFEDGAAAYDRGEYAEALHLFRLAADEGHAGAQLNLGNMYLAGQGTPRDYARAAEWYRRAADSGNAGAQYSLGTLYRNGWGVRRDYARAMQWYRLAAAQGFALAQNNIGAMYDKGLGVPRDDAEAVRWYRLGAEHGSAMAQFNLGLMVQRGRGVPEDQAEARHLFELAADRGVAGAQNQLGILYATGAAGLPRDDVHAVKWFTVAAAHAHGDELRALALKNRERIAARMTPDQLAEAETRARAWSPKGELLAAERSSLGKLQ
jgi:TPR repeat protein